MQIEDLQSVGAKFDKDRKAINVVYIIHESLSGAYALNREEGKQAMPFFNSMRHSHDDFYVFPKSRSVSGDTVNCVTALATTGCLPMTNSGRERTLKRSTATEFKRHGYRTGSFSSRLLNLKGTKWFMLDAYLTANFDHIVDPRSEGFQTVNAEGADDR